MLDLPALGTHVHLVYRQNSRVRRAHLSLDGVLRSGPATGTVRLDRCGTTPAGAPKVPLTLFVSNVQGAEATECHCLATDPSTAL